MKKLLPLLLFLLIVVKVVVKGERVCLSVEMYARTREYLRERKCGGERKDTNEKH